MNNLEALEVPNDGEISLCEVNGCMQTIKYNYLDANTCIDILKTFPTLHITRDMLHSVISKGEGKALFLPVNVSFLKQLTQIYYELGLIEALHIASAHSQILVSKTASVVLNILEYIKKIRTTFNPNVRHSMSNIIDQFSQTRKWQHNTIRCISWHPHVKKVAIVTCDDSVRIFSSDIGNDTISTVIRHRHQRNVTCIAWRYLSNSEIAVGHENGITIWNTDGNSLVSRPSISNALFRKTSEHKPVMSIAWSRKGDKLISCAACDNAILVWDVELNKTNSLKSPGSSGNILVKWSPTGEKLLSCSAGLIFRVWDCCTWQSEKWSLVAGRVQTACWLNDGATLIFATSTDSIIYSLTVKTDQVFTSNIEVSNQALPIFDTTVVDIDGVIVGGLIQCMDSDPSGKHLAVLFQNTNNIVIFSVTSHPEIKLIPSSLVMGLPKEKPSILSFLQHFEAGACLTVGWSSGRIQYYPIIYTDLSALSLMGDSYHTGNK
ncbi:hypothetical protein NQ315_012967 [Exocentrus adspersus]|uniref:Aladin seven-bladed propeller domain-containing protein n=1 Tax=Exocentrus adspersus TaxID=1586481 RepID=A0AAV8VS17_9CUCU|nr:hypothetical protein NQ315_012967 [Exocentrus adspersus]